MLTSTFIVRYAIFVRSVFSGVDVSALVDEAIIWRYNCYERLLMCNEILVL